MNDHQFNNLRDFMIGFLLGLTQKFKYNLTTQEKSQLENLEEVYLNEIYGKKEEPLVP